MKIINDYETGHYFDVQIEKFYYHKIFYLNLTVKKAMNLEPGEQNCLKNNIFLGPILFFCDRFKRDTPYMIKSKQ